MQSLMVHCRHVVNKLVTCWEAPGFQMPQAITAEKQAEYDVLRNAFIAGDVLDKYVYIYNTMQYNTILNCFFIHIAWHYYS